MTRGNIVCDIDGVLFRGEEVVAGSGEALSELDSAGYRIVFATNNAMRPVDEVVAKIVRVTGYAADPAQVVTSALAAAHVLAEEQPDTFLFGAAGARLPLESVGIEIVDEWRSAQAVVVGLDYELSYPSLRAATLAVDAGARFIATNTDATFPTPEGSWPGAGAIVAALATSTGVEPEVVGKPHAPIRELVRQLLASGRTWTVGDRPETDLAMGAAEGWTTVLVMSGVTKDASTVHPTPNKVLESIADLPALLAQSEP